MATRLTLEPHVFNTGETRFIPSRDFTSVPRLERAPSRRERPSGAGFAWKHLRRMLRAG